MLLLISVLGCVASSQSVIKQNEKLILQDKNYSKALVNLEKAVQTDPKKPELWYWLGYVQYHKGKLQVSIDAFNRAFSLGLPKSYHWVSYYCLGLSNQKLGRFDEAIKNFTQSLEVNPKDVRVTESRGQTYESIRQFDLAHRDFDSILKNDKNHLGALEGKSSAYFNAKEYNQAIQYLTRLINIAPANNVVVLSRTYNARGWSYYYLSQFENARNDFNTAIKTVNPDNHMSIRSTIGKAFCLLGLGDKQTALALIDQAEKYFPPENNLNFERSLIYYLSGDKSAAWNLRGGSGAIGVALKKNDNGHQGLLIVSIMKDSPALTAGLLKGDIITAVDGQAMTDMLVFIKLIAKRVQGTKALIQIIREGFAKKISVEIGSAEKIIEDHQLCKPILDARMASVPEKDMPGSTIQIPEKEEYTLDVSGAGEPSSLITDSQKRTPVEIKINSVMIDPTPVQAGKQFEIIIDLVASDPGSFQTSLPIVVDYSILKDKKLLIKLKPKEFMAPNGEHYTLTRSPKASKIKGSYSLLIELAYNGTKTSKILSFDIE